MENKNEIKSYLEDLIDDSDLSPVEKAKKMSETIKKDPTMLNDIKADLIGRGNKSPVVLTGYLIDQVLKAENVGIENHEVSNLSFATYTQNPLNARSVIIKEVLSNRIGVANSSNIIAQNLDQISDPEFLKETIKLLKERIEISGKIIEGRTVPLIGTPYENEEILKNLDSYTKGKRLSNNRDIVDEVLSNPKIKIEDKPQVIIDVLKGRKEDDYNNSLESLTEHLFENRINPTVSAFVIKEVLKADHIGLNNYKKSPFEAILAGNDIGEISHIIFSKAHQEKTLEAENISNIVLEHLDKIAINRPDLLNDVKEDLKFRFSNNRVRFEDSVEKQILTEIDEHKVGMRRYSLENKIHSILDDVKLSSQEKMKEVQFELSYSSAKGTYDQDFEKAINTVFEHRDIELSKFMIEQMQKMDNQGIGNYKASGIDFINFNADPNEAAHFVVSKGLEKEKEGPKSVFNEMAKSLDQLKSGELFKETITAVKSKVEQIVKSNKVFEGLSEKFNNYVKGYREEENMAKNLVNFVKGIAKKEKEPDNKKTMKNNI